MTCKDCIHYDVCHFHIDEETPMTINECDHFKNKADYVEVEKLKKFKYYFDDLYGIGLEVAGWHYNGMLEPFDSFYDSAIEEMTK